MISADNTRFIHFHLTNTMSPFTSKHILLFTFFTIIVCCPPEAPLQFGNQWKRCISENTCRDQHLVIYGSTCVRNCPFGTMYFADRRTCYDDCPSDTLPKGKSCLNGTYCVYQNNSVLFNGSCQHSCPDTAPFVKYGTCYEKCPVETVLKGSLCVVKTECTVNGDFVHNHTCVEECPEDSKYVFLSTCYPSCPDNSFLGHNQTCLSKSECVSKHQGVIFNNTCLSTCPGEAKFASSGMCFSECPKETSTYRNECLTDFACIEKTMVIHENQCVQTCPDVAPHLFNHRCYSRCPLRYVLHNGECISVDQCIDEYNLYKVIFNGSCVDACPPEAPLTSSGFCVGACPVGTVISDRQCIDLDICQSRHMFVFNNSCISSCPLEAPYTKDSICYKECPQLSIRLSNSSLCVTPTKCKGQGMYIENTTCVNKCSPLRPYHLHNDCHTECPVTSNIFKDNQCVVPSECKHIQGAVLYNGSCLPSCPSQAPNRKDSMCYSICPSGYLSKNAICIEEYDCTSSSWVIFNGQCVKSCPEIAPYLDYDNCYASCPFGKLGVNGSSCIFEIECILKHMFIVSGKCIPKCPRETLSFLNTLCYSMFEVKIGIIIFSSIIIVLMMLLFPCIYNPQRSRRMNATKVWRLVEEADDEEDDITCKSKDDSALNDIQTRSTEESYLSVHDSGNTDSLMLEGPDQAGIELNSIVVHHYCSSEDGPLLSGALAEHIGGNGGSDDDDALLFGDGNSEN